MNRSYKTEGVVLKRINLNEADRLVTIFTRSHGKIRVLAKGIRRIRSRKAAHLELFNQATLTLAMGRTLDIVTEASVSQTFEPLRIDLDRIAYAYTVVETIDMLVPDSQPLSQIYTQLLTVLSRVSKEPVPNLQEITETFFLHLLWELGYVSPETKLSGLALARYVEETAEKRLKSRQLLTRIQRKV